MFGWSNDTVSAPCSWTFVQCELQPGYQWSLGGSWVDTPLVELSLGEDLGLIGARWSLEQPPENALGGSQTSGSLCIDAAREHACMVN